MSDQRREWFALLDDIYTDTAHPRGELRICTDCVEAPCEVWPEQVTLLPFEDEFIQKRLAAEGRDVSLETVRGIAGCRECPFFQNRRCAIHPHRPVDCRTYPMVPVFSRPDPEFKVSGVCPLREGMDLPFIRLMRGVWMRLSPRLTSQWKSGYDRRQPREYLRALIQID